MSPFEKMLVAGTTNVFLFAVGMMAYLNLIQLMALAGCPIYIMLLVSACIAGVAIVAVAGKRFPRPGE